MHAFTCSEYKSLIFLLYYIVEILRENTEGYIVEA